MGYQFPPGAVPARYAVLRVENLTISFYQDFRAYVTEKLGQSANTFGKHLDQLNSFLSWGEAEKDLLVLRHY